MWYYKGVAGTKETKRRKQMKKFTGYALLCGLGQVAAIAIGAVFASKVVVVVALAGLMLAGIAMIQD